jgi:hypothetical protein
MAKAGRMMNVSPVPAQSSLGAVGAMASEPMELRCGLRSSWAGRRKLGSP